jgi:hypothetical protein
MEDVRSNGAGNDRVLGSLFLIGNPHPIKEKSYLAVTRLAVSMDPSCLPRILSFS